MNSVSGSDRKKKSLAKCKKCGGLDWLYDDGFCTRCHSTALQVAYLERANGRKVI